MALPKEPRQKMINIMYLVLTALLALNVSSEILNAFKVVDKSLVTSNSNLTTANNTLYTSLLEKVKDPQTSVKAAPWNEKAIQAQKLSAVMDSYINQLKLDLKKEAGSKMVDVDGKPVEQFKEDDLEAATRLFGNGPGGQDKGPELMKKLNEFRDALLNIDPEIRKTYDKSLAVDVSGSVIGQDGKKKEFTEAYFHMTPTVAGITLLSKFQNNVKNAENQIVTYCHNQVGAVKVVYDQFAALVGQSSNYVMPGEEVEITAGVGAYSAAAKPVISINGTGSSIGADGRAVSKFQASGGGPHSVPVKVTYTKPDGTTETKSFDVKYTVGTPGGAAVMPTKMNVFYIGVDNPIKVGSPTGMEKTNVTISAGSVSGSGSDRVVRVSSIGNVTVNVTTDKGSFPFSFRVKKIPDPVFKIGSGKARVATVEFKSQTSCRAELENFDFDLRYSVTGATVYFSGANFPSPATASISSNSLAPLSALIARSGPGTSVTFVNIRVQGPDGPRVIDERSITLY